MHTNPNGASTAPSAKSTSDNTDMAGPESQAVSENMAVVFDELDNTASRRDALLAQLQGKNLTGIN